MEHIGDNNRALQQEMDYQEYLAEEMLRTESRDLTNKISERSVRLSQRLEAPNFWDRFYYICDHFTHAMRKKTVNLFQQIQGFEFNENFASADNAQRFGNLMHPSSASHTQTQALRRPSLELATLLGRSPTLNALRHKLVVWPVSIGNIDIANGALTDRLQDSLVPLCLGAKSQAPHTFGIIKASKVEQLHQSLNSVFPAIQFTREEATGEPGPRKFYSLPSMEGISEAIARQLNRFGMSIVHKPASSLCATLSRVKDLVPKGQQTNVIHRIPWANCSCIYIGYTGRRLGTRIMEHKLAIRRRDPLSLVFAHALEFDHRFNWDGTEVVAMANTKQACEFLEEWLPSTTSINRHVDLDSHYEGLRARLTNLRPQPNNSR
ncbi:unnamed protein product [Schistocephalus solidus]|uniref:GIY-YIG domain-containing protein n=1 Tax=Schistocephalus solidus TaxID=70667 RepID=A0A183SWU8_SCHSO|nr:unnamed protein product [Schistocephalus solidus]